MVPAGEDASRTVPPEASAVRRAMSSPSPVVARPDGDPEAGALGGVREDVAEQRVHGVPQFSVEGPRNDSSHGGDGDTTTTAPATTTGSSSPSTPGPSSSAAPSGDDSDGRVGGSDDSGDDAGDDSSGRSGGGHGCDD